MFLPAATKANTITEDFSVTVPSTVLVGGFEDNFPTTSFLKFAPANGTLDSIDVALSGSATWTTSADFVETSLFLHSTHIEIAQSPFQIIFNTPVTLDYTVSITGHDIATPQDIAIPELMGTGSTVLDFDVEGAPKDVFASKGALTGSITFNFTPPTVGVVPEASTWAMMLLGFGGPGLSYRKAFRSARAV